jgi:hypothetical protein
MKCVTYCIPPSPEEFSVNVSPDLLVSTFLENAQVARRRPLRGCTVRGTGIVLNPSQKLSTVACSSFDMYADAPTRIHLR